MDDLTLIPDPVSALDGLAPYRARLVTLKMAMRPYSLEWDAVDEAIKALDRVALKLTGRADFYITPRTVPVIGQVFDGGCVRFFARGQAGAPERA